MRPINSLKKFFKLIEWFFVDSIDEEINRIERKECLYPKNSPRRTVK